jgi:sugar O-acyltransferase (sialic acid O-acetyltransferase NeuD family)
MKQLILVGGGDWGLEIFSWMKHARGYNDEWSFKGVLDVSKDNLAEKLQDYYLGTESQYVVLPEDCFVCCVGNVKLKQKVVKILGDKGASFFNIIHNTSFISEGAAFGTGIVVGPFAYISNNTTIGNHVAVNAHSSIGHHVTVGDFCQINSNCDITGHVKLGDGCFVGSSVSIIPKVSIAAYTTIGAGSVVIKSSSKENITLFGNPAKNLM